MKKTLLFLVIFFAGITLLQAQIKLTNESVPVPEFGKSAHPNFLFYDNQNGYTGLYYPPYTGNQLLDRERIPKLMIALGNNSSFKRYTDKEGNNSAIVNFNRSSSEMTQSKFGISDDYDIQTFFNCKDALVGIYSKYDKKEDIYAIYKDRISKNGNKHASSPQLIANFNLSGRDGKLLYFASSPDNTKHVFALVVTDRKKNFKGLYVQMLDENGDKEWERELLPTFPHENFYLHNIEVSSTGEIFMLLNSFAVAKRSKTAESIHIYRVQENDDDLYTIKSPYKNIYDMNLKYVEDEEKVVIGGFYAQSDKHTAVNLFTQVFNVRTESFTDFAKKAIDEDDKKNTKVFSNKINFNYRCIGMELLENGDVVLLGEQFAFYITESMNSNGFGSRVTYHYRFNHIVAAFISYEGEIINTKKIEKNHSAVLKVPIFPQYFAIYGLGTQYFINGSDLYFLFNELTDNYTGKNKKRKALRDSEKDKKTCTMLAKIATDNTVELHMIARYDNDPVRFREMIYNDTQNRTALLLCKAKKNQVIRFLNY